MKVEVNNGLLQDIITGELTPSRVARLWNWKVRNGGFGPAILDYESLGEFDLLQNTAENIRIILKQHGKDAVVSLTFGVFDNYRSTDALRYQTTDDDGGLRINSIEEGGIMWNAILQLLARSYANDDDYDIALIMDGKEDE
jgi:hypothetical protein